MSYTFVDTLTKYRHSLPDSGYIKIGHRNGNHIKPPPILSDVDPDHCEVRITKEGVYVRDMRSREGTYIGMDRLSTDFVELKPGTLLRVGKSLGFKLEKNGDSI